MSLKGEVTSYHVHTIPKLKVLLWLQLILQEWTRAHMLGSKKHIIDIFYKDV